MDLRRRLIGSLSVLLGCLLAITAVIQLVSLRSDIEAEVAASTRLVNVLLAASGVEAGTVADTVADSAVNSVANRGANTAPVHPSPSLDERLAHAGLRHLSIRTASQPAPGAASHPLLAWLGLALPERREQHIRIGGHTLFIAPNPRSEIDERLQDTVQIWSTLCFFFGATLLVTWWCADRALAPVRELEASLQRLARGEPDPALPAFALREFGRVARAIEHLAAALLEARTAQRALARQLIAVQEDERRALARELHDEMGQTLAALSVTAAHLARNAGQLAPAAVADCAGDLRRDLRTCGDQLRGMLRTLRPHGLHASGLAQTLRELVQGWRGRHTGIDFALELSPALSTTLSAASSPASPPAPPDRLADIGDPMALAIYRVVQEAVTNVVRHSGARHCAVRMTAGADALALEVVDDGRGLGEAPRWHGGLLGMRERVEMVGGQLHTLARAGGGLRLYALFPLPAATGHAADAGASAGALS